MTSVSEKQIDAIIERHAAIQREHGDGRYGARDFVAASKEFASSNRRRRRAKSCGCAVNDLVTEMLATRDEGDGGEKSPRFETALPAAENDLALNCLPKDVADARAAMLEIRAGTGGDEAALSRAICCACTGFADGQGWKVEIISDEEAERAATRKSSRPCRGRRVRHG